MREWREMIDNFPDVLTEVRQAALESVQNARRLQDRAVRLQAHAQAERARADEPPWIPVSRNEPRPVPLEVRTLC